MTEKGKYILSEQDVKEVQAKASAKLEELMKTKDIIGTQVFFILGACSKVIYYPLGENAPWGFTDIKGTNDNQSGNVFVVLNSSVSVDCQVFAAAHELYHIWYERKEDVITGSDLDYSDNDRTEQMASRFAAEFLVNEVLLKSSIETYVEDSNNISLKDILKLSELFAVPYKTMVRRLHEIGLLSTNLQEEYLQKTEKVLNAERKRYAISNMKADDRIAIADHTALSVEAFEKGLITYERLEYLLQKSNLTPEDVGIIKDADYQFPSDDELDDIMGE